MSILPLEESVILIVDDNQNNLAVLFDFLTESGFKVLVARTGESAIKKAEYSLPDLILLDVLMPGIDGFETCRLLKAGDLTKEIPVIFMTALDETEDKVKGFNLGAVDYVTKPIQNQEVLARAKAHLSIRKLTQKLQEQNAQMQREIVDRKQAQINLEQLAAELEKRVESRTVELCQTNERLQEEVNQRQQTQENLQQSLHKLQHAQSLLIQSEKMSALGQMVAGIAHEINNPVNFICGNLNYVRDYTEDLLKVLNLYQQHYPEPAAEITSTAEAVEIEFIKDDLLKMLDSMRLGGDRIRDIILSLRYFSRQEGREMELIDIHQGIDSTLMILQNRLKFKANRPAIQVIKEYDTDLKNVECCGGEINQVFMNILANAIDAIEESCAEKTMEEIKINPYQIRICTKVHNPNTAIIKIADSGPGISEDLCDRIFDPFFTTKPVGKGTGIGLSISWHIVTEKHGGSLRCCSTPGQGTEFAIELPIRQKVREMATSGSKIVDR
ncbi:MAG: response regulator [Microcoleus sp. PH2017_25_DOB_D_A]|uniref:hybrid sensor histidine kinase/response regulator n=1 Tax=unclassified Microcoleus TaxID=2642155 RepID=UPI001DED350B|nr:MULTISPECIES: response regulator [unclassified Microcoleus]MCC3442152.1 response regulator [Microcoleus sp. PH2017_03_ELD_O_A]TAE37394.1 MAG: response regulator [Oscillatoriales cyanobacterium]MCC3436015.1 response regulator [Microcoleus sp. PH2017_05_CCC_O_A]MCC3456946.1 response regulator [Microcoleus sp. PH2017_08_TRC_O_A]MCC3474466.1 response regulator [Microcoleus sp. PH2017_13_LAR_U_A]